MAEAVKLTDHRLPVLAAPHVEHVALTLALAKAVRHLGADLPAEIKDEIEAARDKLLGGRADRLFEGGPDEATHIDRINPGDNPADIPGMVPNGIERGPDDAPAAAPGEHDSAGAERAGDTH